MQTILVVDDEPDLESLVTQKMRREIRRGLYKFEFAYNGVEALEKLNENPAIDIVLSDINMPEMDGLTLLSHLPSINPNIHAVVISAYGDMSNIRTAMNRGAFDFITKPVDFDDLKTTINRTVEHLEVWLEAQRSRNILASLQVELAMAAKMQQSILPRDFVDNESIEIFASMVPAREVGGDFYDFVKLERDNIAVAIADVSGKGIVAGMFMMTTRTWMRGCAIGASEPSQVLFETNRQLSRHNDEMMFATVFYATYDPRERLLSYANGGHNPPILVKKEGTCQLLDVEDDIALGVDEEASYRESTIALAPGDFVILYTDGVNEAENADSELLGMDQFFEMFQSADLSTAVSVTDAIFAMVREFVGSYPQSDDITCLVLKVKE